MGFGIAGLDGVITVPATDLNDERAGFSHWGAAIDIAAPGLEVLSLRARRTDTMRDIPDVRYENGRTLVRVHGRADADRFESAQLSLGRGNAPVEWKTVGNALTSPALEGSVGDIDANELRGSVQWTLRLITRHANGREREARFVLDLN